jgi:aryl carrier-like protein
MWSHGKERKEVSCGVDSIRLMQDSVQERAVV